MLWPSAEVPVPSVKAVIHTTSPATGRTTSKPRSRISSLVKSLSSTNSLPRSPIRLVTVTGLTRVPVLVASWRTSRRKFC